MIKKNKGFTLIELMITVAIVGILSAIALPAYQDYTIRSQIAEGMNMVSGAKTFVIDYYTNTGLFPVDNAQAGYPGASGQYTSNINISTGNIIITFSSVSPQKAHTALDGATVTYSPVVDAGTDNITWECSASIADKYLPSSCR